MASLPRQLKKIEKEKNSSLEDNNQINLSTQRLIIFSTNKSIQWTFIKFESAIYRDIYLHTPYLWR